VHFFCIFGFWRCGLLCETGLAGFGNRSDHFVPRVGTCSGGACICAAGALVCFGGLCFLHEHGFVSDVSSRCPCLRGPRLVFFKCSCSLPFSASDRLLKFPFICLFSVSFSLCLANVCVLSMH
jgi:hypothetical protein